MKIIDGAFAHQFEIDMGVGIDAAREKILSADIDFLSGRAQFLADLFDFAAFDADIGNEFLGMGDDRPVAQDEVHGPVSFPVLRRIEYASKYGPARGGRSRKLQAVVPSIADISSRMISSAICNSRADASRVMNPACEVSVTLPIDRRG